MGIKGARGVGCVLCFLCMGQIVQLGDPQERVFCILIGSYFFTCRTVPGAYIMGKIAVAYRFRATGAKLSRGVQIFCMPRVSSS
jgi:hypothetical protein